MAFSRIIITPGNMLGTGEGDEVLIRGMLEVVVHGGILMMVFIYLIYIQNFDFQFLKFEVDSSTYDLFQNRT